MLRAVLRMHLTGRLLYYANLDRRQEFLGRPGGQNVSLSCDTKNSNWENDATTYEA